MTVHSASEICGVTARFFCLPSIRLTNVGQIYPTSVGHASENCRMFKIWENRAVSRCFGEALTYAEIAGQGDI